MSELQIRASDPTISTWVLASAGTGKTKILTDRVMRLLLSGVKVHKILCLTFTNAAANEMYERINNILSSWSRCSCSALDASLTNILGRNPTSFEKNYAKNLYNNILHLEKRINIYTIHSFCQKVLKMFPMESGVRHNFEVIDELKVQKILYNIQKTIFSDKEFHHITDFFIKNFHEITINDLLLDIIDKNVTHNYASNICDTPNHHDSPLSFDHIALYPLVEHYVGINATINEIKQFFLTKTGQKRKNIISSKIVAKGSNTYDELLQIQEELYQLDQKIKAKELLYSSEMMTKLARAIIDKYNHYKVTNNLLDYDDLIHKTQILLTKSESKDWVLYKLDGGIDHLLVDEAQDTSKLQWQIIETLISEFHSGDTSHDLHRTIFVVGDEKQSIFSFQGADVDAFYHMNKLLQQKLSSGQKPFDIINLETSYRSTRAVLDVVYSVFDNIKKTTPHLFSVPYINIKPFRLSHYGKVELWDLCVQPKDEQIFWPIIDSNMNAASSKTLLATKIAKYIDSELKSQKILPATKRKIAPSDFMILFRSRDDFTLEVIKQLKEHNINVSGLDRICLNDNLAIRDLISIAKFALNPKDDLNLSSLLKSPLIGINEEQLQQIIYRSKKNGIWQYLNNQTLDNTDNNAQILTHTRETLMLFLSLYRHSNIHNFFHQILHVLSYRHIVMNAYLSDSHDAIDEFLHLVSDYAQNNDASMSNFLKWFAKQNIDIKRDPSNKDSVSIMTVHGSKGLQARIVILCDTTSTPTLTDRFITDENDRVLFAKSSNNTPEFYQKLKEKYKDKMMQEYMRLLYVAMTRAEDYLIVCGYQGAKTISELCWYNLIQAGMTQSKAQKNDNGMIYETGTMDGDKEIQSAKQQNNNIEYCYPFIIHDQFLKNYNRYISDIDNNTAPTSYISRDKTHNNIHFDALEYGTIFHKIMEDAINHKNIENIHTHPIIDHLNDAAKKTMLNSFNALNQNKDFMDLLQYRLKSELTIGVKICNEVKIGRMDLVIFDDIKNNIVIIDYKTDSTVPNNIHEIPPDYIDQLTFYQSAMKSLYPKYTISTKILWLANGSFINVS